MRSVNVAVLKNKLSTYLGYAKAGETVVVRDRDRPIAKLIPFLAEDASEEAQELAALGILKLADKPMDWAAFDQMPIGVLSGDDAGIPGATQSLIDERNEGW